MIFVFEKLDLSSIFPILGNIFGIYRELYRSVFFKRVRAIHSFIEINAGDANTITSAIASLSNALASFSKPTV